MFIGGCPRSGTTLLGALLGAHSRCVCVPESPFKFKLLLDLDWEEGTPAPGDISRLLQAHPKFRIWGIPADAQLPGSGSGGPPPDSVGNGHRSYRAVVERLVERFAIDVGAGEADVWVDHTPWNIRFVATLLEHFPDARFLHLVRDGRAVAASVLPLPFGSGTSLEAAADWAEWLASGLAAEARFPERVHRVRYEELATDPPGVMARICGQLGIEMEEGLGRWTEFRLPRYAQDTHALVGSPPDPTRVDAWRRSLSDREVEIFEAATRDLLPLMGYEVRFGGKARRATGRERAGSWARAARATVTNRIRTTWKMWRKIPLRPSRR